MGAKIPLYTTFDNTIKIKEINITKRTKCKLYQNIPLLLCDAQNFEQNRAEHPGIPDYFEAE